MFETLVYAAESASSQNGGVTPEAGGGMAALMQFLPIIIIFILFYFMFIMPSRKEQKKHQEMLASLKVGDKIITSGGIIGVISKISDKDEVIQITSSESTKINIMRQYVSRKVEKPLETENKQ